MARSFEELNPLEIMPLRKKEKEMHSSFGSNDDANGDDIDCGDNEGRKREVATET